MENAAKALQIAGAILIGIMILSVAVYLFTASGRLSDSIYSKIEENNIKKFNEQFLKYDGLKDCTVYDIISVANLAKNNNSKYMLSPSDANNKNTYYVRVLIRGDIEFKIRDNLEKAQENDYISLLNSAVNHSKTDFKRYKCEVEISDVTKRVFRVSFEQV